MNSEPPPSSNSTPASRPNGETPRADLRPLHQGLERFRTFVHEQLDRIEALALDRGDASATGPSPREFELRKTIAALEERQARLVIEAKRMEQEWQTGMAKIENDRRLLAEAWDRLERERIEAGGTSAESPRSNSHPGSTLHANPGQASGAGLAPASPVFRPVVTPASNDVVTQAVLSQFQALRSDVRRNAKGRQSHD